MNKGKNSPKWDNREEYLYYFYLQLKYAEYQSYATKKAARVFKYFSGLIGTKDHLQVKSHHQILLKRHSTIQKYIQFYETQNMCRLQQFQKEYLTGKFNTFAKQYTERLSLKKVELNEESVNFNDFIPSMDSKQDEKNIIEDASESNHCTDKYSSLNTREKQSEDDELSSFSIPQLIYDF